MKPSGCLEFPDAPAWAIKSPWKKRILQLVGDHLSVEVSVWKIASDTLVAYPLLTGKPALTFDSSDPGIRWNMDKDKDSGNYLRTLAKVLVDLHGVPKKEVSKMD